MRERIPPLCQCYPQSAGTYPQFWQGYPQSVTEIAYCRAGCPQAPDTYPQTSRDLSTEPAWFSTTYPAHGPPFPQVILILQHVTPGLSTIQNRLSTKNREFVTGYPISSVIFPIVIHRTRQVIHSFGGVIHNCPFKPDPFAMVEMKDAHILWYTRP